MADKMKLNYENDYEASDSEGEYTERQKNLLKKARKGKAKCFKVSVTNFSVIFLIKILVSHFNLFVSLIELIINNFFYSNRSQKARKRRRRNLRL
jgi:hypothetical protein